MRWWDLEEVLPIEQMLFPDTAWTAEMFWSELSGVPRSRHYVVTEWHGEVVGYAGVMVVGADADVQTVGVRVDNQRSGIGSALMDELEQTAVIRRATRIFLEVSAANEHAQSLYLARGYESAGRRKDYYGSGVDAVVMNKRLGPLAELS